MLNLLQWSRESCTMKTVLSKVPTATLLGSLTRAVPRNPASGVEVQPTIIEL